MGNAGITRKDQQRVLEGLAAQGAFIRPSTHGWHITYNGQTANLAGTPGSYRGVLNSRSDIKRIGLHWPLDTKQHPKKQDAQTMNTSTIDLPSYMTEGPNEASVHRIAEIRGALEIVAGTGHPVEISAIHKVLREHGRGFSQAAFASKVIGKFLYRTGWRPIATRKNGMGSILTWGYDPANGIIDGYPDPLPDAVVWPSLEIHVDEPTEEPTVEVLGDQVMLTMRPIEPTALSDEPTAEEMDRAVDAMEAAIAENRAGGPESVEEPEVRDLIQAAADDSETAFWQNEAERLEAELVEAKRATAQAEAAHESSEREVEELEALKTQAATYWQESQAIMKRLEGERDAQKHENDLLHDDIERLRALVATQREEYVDLEARVGTVEAQADGWRDLDLDRLVKQRDGYTLDELIVDSSVFNLSIRVQSRQV